MDLKLDLPLPEPPKAGAPRLSRILPLGSCQSRHLQQLTGCECRRELPPNPFAAERSDSSTKLWCVVRAVYM